MKTEKLESLISAYEEYLDACEKWLKAKSGRCDQAVNEAMAIARERHERKRSSVQK